MVACAVAALALVSACSTVTEGQATMPDTPSHSASGDDVFANAAVGDCLTWPEQTPDQAHSVDCADEHRFEVSEIIDLSSEYGPMAEPPRNREILELSQTRCPEAARTYLGPKFDPTGRFSASMLWSGERAWRDGERRVLCGLQLPGLNGQQLFFTGRVADQDQSKVWPAGTCLGIELSSKQPIDAPVDCAAPHSMEITGSVDVGAQFPGGLPAEGDQDAFIKDSCKRSTDEYLAPTSLRQTTLTVIYSTVARDSWDAGSRRVSCSVGAVSDGAWATLINSAKGELLINGLPPAP